MLSRTDRRGKVTQRAFTLQHGGIRSGAGSLFWRDVELGCMARSLARVTYAPALRPTTAARQRDSSEAIGDRAAVPGSTW